jgi:hypothetical protein
VRVHPLLAVYAAELVFGSFYARSPATPARASLFSCSRTLRVDQKDMREAALKVLVGKVSGSRDNNRHDE